MNRIVEILVEEFNRKTLPKINFDLIGEVLYVGDTKVHKFLTQTLEIMDEGEINSIVDEWAFRVYRDGNMPRIGDVIVMTSDMKDDPNPILKGTMGRVIDYTTNTVFNEDYVDVEWFNGRTLKLIVGLDEFKKVS